MRKRNRDGAKTAAGLILGLTTIGLLFSRTHGQEIPSTVNLKLPVHGYVDIDKDLIVFGAPDVHYYDANDGITTNLGLVPYRGEAPSNSIQVKGQRIAFKAQEREDLNGDGDRSDLFVHLHDTQEGVTRVLGPASDRCADLFLGDDQLFFEASEEASGQDLNDDGDRDDIILHVHELTSSRTTNLRLATNGIQGDAGNLVFVVSESERGQDLNGDGDLGQDQNNDGIVDLREGDQVLHLLDLETGRTTNLGLTVWVPQNCCGRPSDFFRVSGDLIAYAERTSSNEIFVDVSERNLQLHDLTTGVTQNLHMTAYFDPWEPSAYFQFSGDWIAFVVPEAVEEDLNGDGDTRDHFLHVHDAKTGVTTNTGLVPANLFLDCSVGGFQLDRGRVLLGNFGAFRSRPLVLYDAEPDRSVNLGPTLGWFHNTLGIAGDRIAFGLSERVQGEDLNDDGDLEDESILHIADLSAVSFPVPFRRADANADGGVNLTDGIYILDWLFRGGPEPPCRDAADADDNGAVELTDAVGIFGWLFLGHKPPPAPGPTECGTDPTAEKSAPGCLAYGHCP